MNSRLNRLRAGLTRSSRLKNNSGATVNSGGLALNILPREDGQNIRQFASARATLEAGRPPSYRS
ncbi:MAG: hypothetical protein ACR2NN_22040 [Bryobacteraceae bacterium]